MEITLLQIQKIQFDILMFLKEVCEKNKLRYYLAYGTLIGSIRHKGFIPWDDDIDIHMPRPDYLKLVKFLEDEPHPFYKLVSRETNSMFTAPLPKLVDTRTLIKQKYGFIEHVELGIYVDIFLLDGAGYSFEEASERYKKVNKLYRRWIHADTKMFPPSKPKIISFMKWIKNSPYKIKGLYYWLNELEKESSKLNYDECQYVAAFGEGAKTVDTNVWDKRVFGDGKQSLFCGDYFTIPNDADKELIPIYGNYMEIPPENMQKSHHKYEVSILDSSVLSERENT